MPATPSSDRLAALRRQRALVQQHLAWLDQEITAAEGAHGEVGSIRSGTAQVPAAPVIAPVAALSGTAQPASSESPPPDAAEVDAETETSLAEADAMLDRYRRPSTDLQRDVRTGCLLYFAAALLITAVVVVSLYFALRHP
jgi:hypothetical protein